MSEINWFNEQHDQITFTQNEMPLYYSFMLLYGGVYRHQGSGRKGVKKIRDIREKWVTKFRDQGEHLLKIQGSGRTPSEKSGIRERANLYTPPLYEQYEQCYEIELPLHNGIP